MNNYTIPAGKVLGLRTTDKSMISTNGFEWPTQGYAAAPDWSPDPQPGGGLHALLNGQGDESHFTRENTFWQVVEIEAAKVVDLDGKVKFPACNVIYTGDEETARHLIRNAKPAPANQPAQVATVQSAKTTVAPDPVIEATQTPTIQSQGVPKTVCEPIQTQQQWPWSQSDGYTAQAVSASGHGDMIIGVIVLGAMGLGCVGVLLFLTVLLGVFWLGGMGIAALLYALWHYRDTLMDAIAATAKATQRTAVSIENEYVWPVVDWLMPQAQTAQQQIYLIEQQQRPTLYLPLPEQAEQSEPIIMPTKQSEKVKVKHGKQRSI